MNALRNIARFQQISRNISTSNLHCRDLTRIKELQRQFQVDDGVPVYLKRGASDRIIFGMVCLGTACCLGYSAMTIKRIIFPPKPT